MTTIADIVAIQAANDGSGSSDEEDQPKYPNQAKSIADITDQVEKTGNLKRNNHAVVNSFVSGVKDCTSFDEFKAFVEMLPKSNISYGFGYTMNRLLKLLQSEGKLSSEVSTSWSNLKSNDKAAVWEAVDHLFKDGSEKILVGVAPSRIPTSKRNQVVRKYQ